MLLHAPRSAVDNILFCYDKIHLPIPKVCRKRIFYLTQKRKSYRLCLRICQIPIVESAAHAETFAIECKCHGRHQYEIDLLTINDRKRLPLRLQNTVRSLCKIVKRADLDRSHHTALIRHLRHTYALAVSDHLPDDIMRIDLRAERHVTQDRLCLTVQRRREQMIANSLILACAQTLRICFSFGSYPPPNEIFV